MSRFQPGKSGLHLTTVLHGRIWEMIQQMKKRDQRWENRCDVLSSTDQTFLQDRLQDLDRSWMQQIKYLEINLDLSWHGPMQYPRVILQPTIIWLMVIRWWNRLNLGNQTSTYKIIVTPTIFYGDSVCSHAVKTTDTRSTLPKTRCSKSSLTCHGTTTRR